MPRSGREKDLKGMQRFSEWAGKRDMNVRPWLILGKGPTLRKYANIEARDFDVVALNHVVRDVPCQVALMMDFDVFVDCADHIERHAEFVCLPWHPHINNEPSLASLTTLMEQNATLKRLDEQGRLLVFNAETSRGLDSVAEEPVTEIKFFSAEAAVNLLADNGACHIRTLGVDGGRGYDARFSDLMGQTHLANGRDNFDRQFERFAKTLRRHPDILFGPLNVDVPVRIFIGADETQRLGAELFKFSVLKYASISVRFHIIDNKGLPVPSDPKKQARTGFSFCRFKIPQMCHYQGRAIYVDADMQVFTDIKDLWQRPFGDAWLLYSELQEDGGKKRIPQYSVMLLDCKALNWDPVEIVRSLDREEMDYAKLMWEFSMMPADRKQALLEFEWNSLEYFEQGRTKLIHYTDMPTQPWVSRKNKNGEVWYKDVREAVASGFLSLDNIHAEIEKGHISPHLPEWVGLKPHPRAAALARGWVPPFRRLPGHK